MSTTLQISLDKDRERQLISVISKQPKRFAEMGLTEAGANILFGEMDKISPIKKIAPTKEQPVAAVPQDPANGGESNE